MESALRLGLSWEEQDLQDHRNRIPHPILLPCKFPGELSQHRMLGGPSPLFYSFLCTPTLRWVKEMWECANVLWIYEYVGVYAVCVNIHGYVLCQSTR